MKSFTRAHVAAAFALIIAISAGTAVAAAPSTPSTMPEQSLRASVTGGGLSFSDALAKAQLSDQQRAAADKILNQASQKQQAAAAAAGAAVDKLHAALADQVGEGSVDENALTGYLDAFAKAIEDWAAATQKALVDLHDLLDPQQRAAFADAMESAIMAEAPKAPQPESWIDTLAKDLGLSDDQKRRIQDVAAKEPAPSDTRNDQVAAYEDFKKDEYPPKNLPPPADVGAKARAALQRNIALTKEIVAILTPDQRVAYANELRGTPTKGGAASVSSQGR